MVAIRVLDPTTREVVLDHGPIAHFRPAMTVGYRGSSKLLANLEPGQRVRFALRIDDITLRRVIRLSSR